MKFYSKTDIGIKRSMNQDYLYATDESIGSFQNLFIVADGMGGHKAGDQASRLCVESLVSYIENSSHTTPVSILNEAITYANNQVFEKADGNPDLSGMGTTLVAATVMDDTLYVANIGDSRLYHITSDGDMDEIQQITNDHSLVEEMVKMGNITESEARIHPKKNIITRALGIDMDVTADYFEIKLMPGDRILLCSDGLTNMVEDYDIQYIIKHADSVKDAVENLVKKANENGGSDNISVILAEL